jgi:uncharacterized membrane protein YphA (DoxX/SURF4 family)
MRIVNGGHLLFAVTMIALGITGLVMGMAWASFAPGWAPVPDGAPGRVMLMYLCSLVSLGTGAGMLWQRTACAAARLLLGVFLFWFLVLRIPGILVSPTFAVFWPGFTTAFLMAGAWILYAEFASEWDKRNLGLLCGRNGVRIARALYGASLIFFGFAHFYDLPDTVSLVPAWLPWHAFWAYFTGSAFVAAGLAVLIGVYARLAAVLAALQIGLLLMLVWIPIVADGSKDAFQWSETFLNWIMLASAWVVAESYRDMAKFSATERQGERGETVSTAS